MITAKYSAVINSVDSNNWILAINREFGSLIENNTFEWQKAQEIKILSAVDGFLL